MRPCLVISPSACAWPNTDHGPVQGATRTFHPGQGRDLCSAACWQTGRSRGHRDHSTNVRARHYRTTSSTRGGPSPEPARLAKASRPGLDQTRGPDHTRRRRAGSLSPRGGPAARWGPSGVPGRRPFAPSRALGPRGAVRACYMCQNGPPQWFSGGPSTMDDRSLCPSRRGRPRWIRGLWSRRGG